MARQKQPKPEPGHEAELLLYRVGRHHFAFLKGYLEGLDIRLLAERYLETVDESMDMRVVLSTLSWIRHELRLLARRFGRPSVARVIMLNPDQLVDSNSKIPSLEEFREERDPHEMYSEADLIELFEEEYTGHDTNSKAERNIRLRQRQNDALIWLQEMVVADPTLQDNVLAWLRPTLAKKLVRAGVNTIEELIEAINSYGYRWYSQVPTLGEKSAKHIVKWLTLNEAALACSLEKYTLSKRSELNVVAIKQDRSKVQGIVPLEYFKPSSALDGSNGINRGERNKLGVENDYDAIQLWLRTFPLNSNTYLSYRNQAERFLLWSLLERGKPISSLDTRDCLAYRDFLWDLGRLSPDSWRVVYRVPESAWLGKRNTERWSPNWRPFEELKPLKPPKDVPILQRKQWMIENTERSGVLKLSSQRLAQTVLTSMCEWLVKRRYLDSNPWDGIKSRMSNAPEIAIDHSFTQDEWDFILQELYKLEKDSRFFRLQFILLLGYLTGLRLSEMGNALKSDLTFKKAAQGNKAGWLLTVVGKGNKARKVPFPAPVMDALEVYLAHRGFQTFNDAPPDLPLIGFILDSPTHLNKLNKIDKKQDEGAKISESRIYRSLKKFFNQVADAYEHISKDGANQMRKASTHWLRHTSGSHAVANGVPVEVVQENFGHASIDTTTIYVTAELDRRIELMEQFAQKSKAGVSI